MRSNWMKWLVFAGTLIPWPVSAQQTCVKHFSDGRHSPDWTRRGSAPPLSSQYPDPAEQVSCVLDFDKELPSPLSTSVSAHE